MANFSRTTLATISALQKRQREPKVVYQKALLSHLYPFYHYEQSEVKVERGAQYSVKLGDTSKESSNISITFEMDIINSLKVLDAINDSYNTSSAFDLQLDIRVTNFVDLEEIDDKYVTASALGLDLDINYINFIDFSVEDSYTAYSSFELSITT